MKHALIISLTFVGMTWGLSPAWSLFEEDKKSLLQGANITMTEAVEKALTNVKGKAVEAELEKEDDKTVFEIKVVDEAGVTQEVYVDANSGEVLKIEKD